MPLFDDIRELSLHLATHAEEVDQSFAPPRAGLEKLASTGYFAYITDGTPPRRRRLLDLLSSGCGVTAFLSSQHEAVCRRLFRAGHPMLEEATSGRVWFGVCFAHLRRHPSPVTVAQTAESLVYQGHGPWFSGLGLMDRMLVGGATAGGEFLMAQTSVHRAGIEVGEAPRLAVMNATATVPLSFSHLEIATSEIVERSNAESLNLADMHSTVFQSARSLGVARACCRHLPASATDQVLARIDVQHASMDAWDLSPSWPQATRLRAEAIELASLAVSTALVCGGGSCHSLTHPVQRLAREASFYATTQLTRELKDHYLANL